MKKRSLLVILVLLLLAGLLAACATDTPGTTPPETTPGTTSGTEDTALPFKRGGVSLYKLVGETYYTACQIVLNGSRCDYSWRHEVMAPYIESLFGTDRASGKFKPERIISEKGEKELLVGLTDRPESLQALEELAYNEWIITELNGKLVVTGWYDAATVAAAEHLYSLVEKSDDASLTLPIRGTVKNKLVTDIPKCTQGRFGGGIDGDEDTLVLRYVDVEKEDFEAYTAQLAAQGYTLYQENAIVNYDKVNNLFATYVKGEKVVHVIFAPYVLDEADRAVLKGAQKNGFRPDGNEMRIITDTADHLFTNKETDIYEDAGIAPAMTVLSVENFAADNPASQCLIYTLADGSFIVVDSGMPHDAEKLYKTLKHLNQREDGQIIIAAWIMSHGHVDHYGGLQELATRSFAKEITIQQYISAPISDYAAWRMSNDPYQYSGALNDYYLQENSLRILLKRFNDSENIRYIHPHMGQKMYIRNAVVEMLYCADEDIFPAIFNNDNATSMVFRVELGDTVILNLNDSSREEGSTVLWPLFSQALDCDIVSMAHHGLGGNHEWLYALMEPEVVVWNTITAVMEKHGFMDNWGINIKTAPCHVVAEDYVKTLMLPFHVETDSVIEFDPKAT